ncbi:tripartite ATP-independent periplasmic transporter [Oceaniovalibus guishaninsula JLT2003]|uniref:TRAP transporter small permease protein n=1 Tax=Oceaniovalibus guishaninsula JLT2003 TaxID=1231392 RepID=K2GTB1_9RHOB|nr:TRAP transporter small permease [Oceaniovalibus guishaninsula]EKE45791.1 tripartite ATP-independent periplasmic transporter [Oceaniovalibus guishaninsula JLT2003]
MGILRALLVPFQAFNDAVLPVGRWVAIVAVALMVAVTLVQVFARYVLNSALPWPDEAARFMMLWMTGLMAPVAYRRGGFVAIDMLPRALPPAAAAALSLVLLAIAGVVLAFAVRIGWAEVTGFGGQFATASLYLPLPDGWFRIPRSWMMAAFLLGMVLLLIVNIELILRALLSLGGARDLKPLEAPPDEIMAE